ncbi:MAG: RNA polymerase sigma-70 factor [Bacteroidota bacterium]
MKKRDSTIDPFAEWAREIQHSSDIAFNHLFRALYEPLVRFAMKYTRSKATACDIVQDIFVQLWQQRSEINPEQSIRSWLYTSVRNRSLNYLRDHQRESVGLDLEPATPLTDGDNTNNRVDRQQWSQLQDWIGMLPDRQKEAFTLSRLEGLDHEEIALVMKISVRTVNNHIIQALQTLREKGQNSSHPSESVHYE